MVSMKEIAGVCGVSEATVSNALLGKDGVGVKTRERIKAVAHKYNYIPNALVRGIQNGFTKTIGLIAGNEYGDAFAGRVVKGIDKAIIAEEYSAIIVHLNEAGVVDHDVKLIRNFAERRVDGLLVVGKKFDGSVFLRELRNFNGPVVLVDQSAPGDEFDFVGSDDISGVEDVTEHLISLGHCDIAFFGNSSVTTGMNRLEGFRRSMSKHGVAVQSNLICDTAGRDVYNVFKKMLLREKRPSAIVCFNDLYALEALAVAYDIGLKVPEELSVTGFSDLPISAQVRPSITTVTQNAEDMGEVGAKLLLRRIAENIAAKPKEYSIVAPENILLPTKLIIRNSTCTVNFNNINEN